MNDLCWQAMNQMDNREQLQAVKDIQQNVDSLYQRNDTELEKIRELIEVCIHAHIRLLCVI